MVAAAVGVPHCRIWVLVRPARFVSIARTSNWLLPVSLGRACLAEWPDPLLTWGMPIVCHALQHADLSEREVEATVRDYRAAAHPPAEGLEQPDGGERHAAAAAAAAAGGGSPEQDGRRQAAARPFVAVLATTDAGLRSLPKELLPLSPTLLVSYDLPTRKVSGPLGVGGAVWTGDGRWRHTQAPLLYCTLQPVVLPPVLQDVYQRRITHVLGSRSSAGGQRIAVNFAIAGQLEEFRQVGGGALGWCGCGWSEVGDMEWAGLAAGGVPQGGWMRQAWDA